MRRKQPYILVLFFLASLAGTAQQRIRFMLTDAVSGRAVTGASVRIPGVELHQITDTAGAATPLLPKGNWQVQFYATGYVTASVPVTIPAADTVIEIGMNPAGEEKQELIISVLRTDTRPDQTVARVEVISQDVIETESGIKPAHIAGLPGKHTSIQRQQTSAITGNTSLRMQGLPGDYTQLLRNGIPLFGGYAASFNILQVAPLDLAQIEIISGPGSSLYGNGAIAGLINLVSKKPVSGKKERHLLVNQSTLGESNLNLYLAEREKKIGYTFFSGGTYQRQMDVNRDGFSDVPATEQIFFHPVFYFYPDEKTTVSAGLNSVFEERNGGDMQVLRNRPTALHQFYIENQSLRNTLDLTLDKRYRKEDRLSVKIMAGNYKRDITTNTFGMKARQLSLYAEGSYLLNLPRHRVVGGISFTSDHFKKGGPDSTLISDYRHFTPGLFIQDDWRIRPAITIESSIRADYHSVYGGFVVPRLAAFIRISPALTTRFGGGTGYRVPAAIQYDLDERNYRYLMLDETVKAERSLGFNWDLNYKKQVGETGLLISQSVYYTRVSNPLVPFIAPGNPPAFVYYYSAAKPLVSTSAETRVQLAYRKMSGWLGYTFTDARKRYDAVQPYLELSIRHKLSGLFTYAFSKNFRATATAIYTGKQYLYNGDTSPSFPFVNAMARYDIRHFSFVLNVENLLDYRQDKQAPLINPPFTNPQFDPLWGPITGRVVNLSVKISW